MITFESKIPELQDLIRSRKKKFGKMLPPSMDWEDVENIILVHFFKKWEMWNQERPFNNWANRVITNQIYNVIRNNYVSFQKPEWDASEDEVKRWEAAQNKSIKAPTSLDRLEFFLGEQADESIDYVYAIGKIKQEMSKSFDERYYRAFEMIYFENVSDDEVAKFLKSRTSEAGRKAGYRWLAIIKKRFKVRIMEIIEEHLC